MNFNKLVYLHFLTNFSFYTLKSFLILYLTQQMGLETSQALVFFGNVMGMSYLLTLWIAGVSDKYLTPALSIAIGVFFLIFGFVSLPFLNETLKSVGFTFICLAAGFYKPAILAEISKPQENSHKKTLMGFYGITNLSTISAGIMAGMCIGYIGMSGIFFILGGLLIHPFYLACAHISKNEFNLKFVKAVCIATLITICIFISFQNTLLMKTFLPFLLLGTMIYLLKDKHIRQKHIVAVLLSFTVFAMFMEIFAGATTLYIQHHIHREIAGFNIPTPYFHSLNPFIITIIAGLSYFIVKKRQPSPSPASYLNGFMVLSLSSFLLLLSTNLPSIFHLPLLISVIVIQTIAELLIVPKSLEILGQNASPQNRQKTMSFWLGCISGAHILASHISSFCLNTGTIPEKKEFVVFYGVLLAIALSLSMTFAGYIFFRKKQASKQPQIITNPL